MLRWYDEVNLHFVGTVVDVTGSAVTGPIDDIAGLLRRGNIHELSKMFSPDMGITILDQDGVYSKVQAELILNKFFSENKPRTVKVLHKINSNPNYELGVLLLTSAKGTFRISYTLKQTGGTIVMIEMRIENEMVK